MLLWRSIGTLGSEPNTRERMGEIGSKAFLNPISDHFAARVSQVIQPYKRARLDRHGRLPLTRPNPEVANDRYRANCFKCFWNIR